MGSTGWLRLGSRYVTVCDDSYKLSQYTKEWGTKLISYGPLFPNLSRVVNTNVSYWISRLYLTGVTTAQLLQKGMWLK